MTKRIFPPLLGAGFFFLIFRGDVAADAIRQGLRLCANTLIPSLFPYLVLTSLLTKFQNSEGYIHRALAALFQISPSASATVLIGNVGGFPTGAAAVAALYQEGKISRTDAEKLLFFSCNCGPGFLIAVIGLSIYRNPSYGLILLLIQLLVTLITGLLATKIFGKDVLAVKDRAEDSVNGMRSLVEVLTKSGKVMLSLCSFVCFFSLVVAAEGLLPLSGQFHAVLAALTELSTGIISLSVADIPWLIKFPLTAMCTAFGGLCVLSQTAALLSPAGLSPLPYLKGKLVQAGLSALLALPFALLIRPVQETAGLPVTFVPLSPWPWVLCSLGLVAVTFLKIPSRNSEVHGL